MPESISPDDSKPDNLEQVASTFLGKFFDWRMTILLFIFYIILNTNVFLERILNNVPGAVINNLYPSTTGVLIQATLMVLFYIIVNGLINITD